jgi:hypothetical protein
MLPAFDAATKLPYGSMAWVHLGILGHNLIHSLCVKVDKSAVLKYSAWIHFPKAIKHLGRYPRPCSRRFPQFM